MHLNAFMRITPVVDGDQKQEGSKDVLVAQATPMALGRLFLSGEVTSA
jgi:hypothetical protein